MKPKQERHSHTLHDYSNRHNMMISDLKKRFWLSTILSVPVIALSPMIQEILGFNWVFNQSIYVLFIISSAIFFYGGWPFLAGLISELKSKAPGMMTLIAIAIIVAYTYSSAVVFGLVGKTFFWELVTLIDIMLLGHWIEMQSELGVSKTLELLVNIMPISAHKIVGDETQETNIDQLQKNDIILVAPGEKVPIDGIITQGESFLNESMLTGKSQPVKKKINNWVIGGSINGSNSIKIKYSGEESYFNRVIEQVQQAQKYKSKTQRFADLVAKYLTYISLSAGIITLITWLSLGSEFAYALERMVTVMIISCPHALGLAIPLVVSISTSVSAHKGLLIRNRLAFENSRKINIVIFDKTGTLTNGKFEIIRYKSLVDDYQDQEILKMSAAVEKNSEHFIAQSILRKSKELKLNISEVKNFLAEPGKGVEGDVDGKKIAIVSPNYLKEKNISIPEHALGDKAETVVFVLINEKLTGLISLADQIRPESYETVKILKSQGIHVVMATGDNMETAKAVSDKLELDSFYAELLPDEKVEAVKEIKKRYGFIAMIGDGINDAPAMAQADVGIAIGSGSNIAAETADIILINSNLKDITKLIIFGRATYRKMIQNLTWAIAYNAFSIPLAAGVLYSQGMVMSPAVGAVFMSISTIIVAINAQLLKNEIN